MLLNILAGALVATVIPQSTDTTFAVDPDMRLELQNSSGYIIVRTWDRNEVRVRADNIFRGGFVIQRTSSTLRIRARSWDDDDDIDYLLTVPASMDLELRASDGDITVDGTLGDVNVRTSDGDIIIRGGSGRVFAYASDGSITAEGVGGQIRLETSDGDITVEGASGDIEIDATDGTVELWEIEASSVKVDNVDGDIMFDGILAPRGSYSFVTHDGDISLRIPEDSDVRARFGIYDGEFSSDFTITYPSWPRGRRVEFTLGTGSAELVVETFDGDITLMPRR
ncbi:MAG: DUF4097 family beta strand repeat protein [Gemmatimonadota bacterium]|nr:MAG: DUF4097 family beta strand repeat protein [Gemmatimonadota bacterium]